MSEHLQLKLNRFSEYIHDWAIRKGFWNDPMTSATPTKLLLMHSEITEAAEADRKDRWCDKQYAHKLFTKAESKEEFISLYETHVKDTVQAELGGCFIRILDFCAKHRIDIEWFIRMEMEYNETRPHKHGGKRY